MQHAVNDGKQSKMPERRIGKLIRVCVLWTVLLAALVQVSGPASAFAEGETAAARETRTLTERFYACDRYNIWNYEFSDGYFFLPSDIYHHPFARVSAGLALSAARAGDQEDQGRCLVTFLRDLGFEEIDAHTYDTDPTADSVALGIGHKKVDDVTVIALAVCGGNYRAEWANNVKIGDGVLSEGFAESAQIVMDELDAYLEKHPAVGDRKLWITGYSRGGAVANIAAAACTDSGRFQDVYAYTFACPRTTRQPGDYRNIFNILRKNDPIPKIPLADWGYQRHGIDMLIVSPDTDPGSEEILKRTAELYREMSGSEMVMNAELNYHVRNILDYLLYLLPDSGSYARLLQPVLRDVMSGSDHAELSLNTLIEALSRFTAENEEQEAEVTELKDYLESLVQVYILQDGTKDLPPTLWDPELGLENLAGEHFEYRYLSSLYASEDPEELFSENTAFVRLVIQGDADAEIYDGDTLIRTVIPEEAENAAVRGDDVYSYPMVRCAEHKMVISLTADRSYTVRVRSRAALPQVLVYSGNCYSGDTVRAGTDLFYFRLMKRGDSATIVTSGDGRVIDPEKSDFDRSSKLLSNKYSPSVAIAMEENKVAHLSIDRVIRFLAALLLFLLIQAIVSLVLAIRRRIIGAERNTTATAVWHGMNVFVFAFCELSIWLFIPSAPLLKRIPMVLALLVLLAFAWKLYQKYATQKTFRSFLGYAAALAAFGLLDGLLAGKYSTGKAAVLILIYTLAFVIPLFLFQRPADGPVVEG